MGAAVIKDRTTTHPKPKPTNTKKSVSPLHPTFTPPRPKESGAWGERNAGGSLAPTPRAPGNQSQPQVWSDKMLLAATNKLPVGRLLGARIVRRGRLLGARFAVAYAVNRSYRSYTSYTYWRLITFISVASAWRGLLWGCGAISFADVPLHGIANGRHAKYKAQKYRPI